MLPLAEMQPLGAGAVSACVDLLLLLLQEWTGMNVLVLFEGDRCAYICAKIAQLLNLPEALPIGEAIAHRRNVALILIAAVKERSVCALPSLGLSRQRERAVRLYLLSQLQRTLSHL